MTTVAALYRFARVADPPALRDRLHARLHRAGVTGTLLVAREGLNGTLAGNDAPLRRFVSDLRRDPRFADLDVRWSHADPAPFRRLRVRLKRELVPLGVPDVDATDAGSYVEPDAWNDLLDDPGVTVVDVRNDYETAVGTFITARGPAVDPRTGHFRDFAAWAAAHLDPVTTPRVAMFCTGGIRCEKSTALLKARGFAEVHHLRGGILRYLEATPPAQNRFAGDCFVFDRRVAVRAAAGGGLTASDYALCFACGWAVAPADRDHRAWIPGESCPRCVDRHTPEQRARFRMRQRQAEAAAQPR